MKDVSFALAIDLVIHPHGRTFLQDRKHPQLGYWIQRICRCRAIDALDDEGERCSCSWKARLQIGGEGCPPTRTVSPNVSCCFEKLAEEGFTLSDHPNFKYIT